MHGLASYPWSVAVAEPEPDFGELPLEVVGGGVEVRIAAGGQVVEQAGQAESGGVGVVDMRHGGFLSSD